MSKTSIYALAALVVLVLAVAAYAGDSRDSGCLTTGACGNCYTPGYDRTPIYVAPEGRGPYGGPPLEVRPVPVDPWAKCGAFCAAGQLAPGWPYGWHDEYWLRPDSNL